MRKMLFGLLAVSLAVGVLVAQDKPKDEPKKPDAPKPEEPKKPETPPPAGLSTDYYPLAKGSKWTYSMGPTEVVVKVLDVAADGSATVVTEHSGKQVAKETLQVKADGVYRVKVNDTPIENGGVKILGLKDGKPAKGEGWDVKAKVATSDVTGRFEVKDVQPKVTVGGKDYSDVAQVEGPKFTIAGTETSVKIWYAPKSGIVKLNYSIGGVESTPLELKSFEAGK